MDRQDERIERLGSSVDYEREHRARAYNHFPDCPKFLGRLGELGRSRGIGSRKAQRRGNDREERAVVAIMGYDYSTCEDRDRLLEGIGELCWPMGMDGPQGFN